MTDLRTVLRSGTRRHPYVDTAWQDWLHRAACRDPHVDQELFFAEMTSEEKKRIRRYGGFTSAERKAKAICARCPVKEQCLRLLYTTGDQGGIWGGTTERERRRVKHEVSCDRRCGKLKILFRLVHEATETELLSGRVSGCRPIEERITILLGDMQTQAEVNGWVRKEKTA